MGISEWSRELPASCPEFVLLDSVDEGVAMGFRRDGETEHRDKQTWDAWKLANADLLAGCGLPLGVLRSRRDWEYLLEHGYWCEEYYGEHVGNIDFELDELNQSQNDAFRQLLERTLTEDEKRTGCPGWHHVHPPQP